MTTIANFDNYVIFHGPPFVGKSSYYAHVLSKTHERVCPNEIFQTGVASSMRQIINNCITKPLLKGKKVAVDDSMQTLALRNSYINTVLEKIPEINCTCVVFRPEFGREQLMWKREICLAEAVLNEEWHFVEKILSTDIGRWYEECDVVSDDEDVRKVVVTIPLQIYSSRPFNLPCLLIEYKGLIDPNLPSVLESWYRRNPHGRIVAVFETNQTAKNDEVKKSVKEFLRCIQIKTELVVYALHVDGSNPFDMATFTASVIAFLMRLHCLDIFSSNSVLLYESMRFRKMAELIGIRHLRFDRALSNPDLLRHGTTQFPIPSLLKSLQVVPLDKKPIPGEEEISSGPTVPLTKEALESPDCIGKVSVGTQCSLYVAARNREILIRYRQQSLSFGETAAVNEEPSTSKPAVRETCEKRRRIPKSSYVALPDWMLSKRQKTKEDITGPKEGPLPSTIYVMTEKELMSTALMILDEHGEPDSTDEAQKKRSDNGGRLDLGKYIENGRNSKTKEQETDVGTSISNRVVLDGDRQAERYSDVTNEKIINVTKDTLNNEQCTLDPVVEKTDLKVLKGSETKEVSSSNCKPLNSGNKLRNCDSDLSNFIDHLIM